MSSITRLTGTGYLLPLQTGNGGKFLTTDGSVLSWATAGGGGVTGSGTTNYLSKWTSATALGNSLIYESGTNVGIGTLTFVDYKLTVAGAIAALSGGLVSNSNSGIDSNLYGSGQIVSGSSSQPTLYLDTTWNTTGNPSLIDVNATNTASGASSKLLNLKVDFTTMFSVSKGGAAITPDYYIKVEIDGQIYAIPALQGLP
jgi:hypothetical protein